MGARIRMKRKEGDNVPDPNDPPGTFCWRQQTGPVSSGRFLLFVCPRSPRGVYCGVPIRPHKLPNGASWVWDGDEDSPTLTPSVNCAGGCGWHGFIKHGEMTNV